jgi:DNA polymerase-3 subunit gamma/tau
MTIYKSLPIKYRPSDFKDIVGQDDIVSILNQAIIDNTLSQSLLFCGPHGVGKTTCARILAKKINNFHHDSDSSYNIIELDGASHNSVEDIRFLINEIQYRPQIGNYKVYIIDEVHMFSNAAFNAFLKILEEPPLHVIFILATTEKYKILSSVLSRCQVYEFKPIDIRAIVGKLHDVSNKENIKINNESLFLISQHADGDLRKALFLLDKVKLHKTDIHDINKSLGIIGQHVYFKIINYLIKNKISDILLIFNNFISQGYDCDIFITGLINHIRFLLFASNVNTLPLVELSDDYQKLYVEQSSLINNILLNKILISCKKILYKYKHVINVMFFIELFLIDLNSLFSKYQNNICISDDKINITQIVNNFMLKNQNLKFIKNIFKNLHMSFIDNKICIYFNGVIFLLMFFYCKNKFTDYLKRLTHKNIYYMLFVKDYTQKHIQINNTCLNILDSHYDIIYRLIKELGLFI